MAESNPKLESWMLLARSPQGAAAAKIAPDATSTVCLAPVPSLTAQIARWADAIAGGICLWRAASIVKHPSCEPSLHGPDRGRQAY